jgi:hypothetical protein
MRPIMPSDQPNDPNALPHTHGEPVYRMADVVAFDQTWRTADEDEDDDLDGEDDDDDEDADDEDEADDEEEDEFDDDDDDVVEGGTDE